MQKIRVKERRTIGLLMEHLHTQKEGWGATYDKELFARTSSGGKKTAALAGMAAAFAAIRGEAPELVVSAISTIVDGKTREIESDRQKNDIARTFSQFLKPEEAPKDLENLKRRMVFIQYVFNTIINE